MTRPINPAASQLRKLPPSGNTGVERGAAPATLPIGATCEPLPCGLQRAETPTGAAGASNCSTSSCGEAQHELQSCAETGLPGTVSGKSPVCFPATPIPPHMIATVRNNQLPTAELAELLNASPAEIDAIRALGHYSGGGLLESSRLIARDLGSAVVL